MNYPQKSSSKIATKLFLLILLGIIYPFILTAQKDLPDPMKPLRMVNDFSNVFSSQQQASLEGKLRNYHNNTTVQIYVVTVNTLNGDAPYNYAAKLGEKWGIGQKGKDNGVLILIKPKTKEERGDVFIAPGYGLEALLNDAYCGRIIDNEMLPSLKNNDYYTAANNAVDAIINRLSDEEATDGSEVINQHTQGDSSSTWVDALIACIMLPLFIICMVIFPRFRAVVFYILLLLMRSGGGSGRGGGGSFGGGGGGRFGGGGSGRSW